MHCPKLLFDEELFLPERGKRCMSSKAVWSFGLVRAHANWPYTDSDPARYGLEF
jgi:hypothetical protein